MYLLKLAALLFVHTTDAFNVDVSPESVVRFTIKVPGTTNESIFASYKLSTSIENQTLRILAGAPKFDPDPQRPYLTNGTILECRLALESFRPRENGTYLLNSTQPNCSVFLSDDKLALGDDHVAGSDALGSTLLPIKNKALAVCTSGRQKKCQTSYFSPGACFSGSTPDQFTPIVWEEKRCFLHYVDMLYLVDSSGSVSDTEFATMRNIMLSVSDVFTNIIGDTTQVAILQYGQNNPFALDYASPLPQYYRQPAKFGQCNTVQCLKNTISSNMIHMKAANTYTATAIKRAALIDFAESKNAAVAQKVLVVITDGDATDWRLLTDMYKLTQEKNIIVYAIGVGNAINQQYLKMSANGGVSNERVLTATDFSHLLVTLKSLTQKISDDNSEGQTAISVENATENALFGFSGIKTKDGGVALGAIGAYQNLGTVVQYDTPQLTNPQMLTYKQVAAALPGLTMDTYDSYLGYDITSGNYEGGTTTYTAAAAPRYQLLGAVVIFQTQRQTNFTIQAPNNFQQHGSYFGASLISCDVDNDTSDDLLVGAPLYIGDNYDEGRVFVYSSFNGSFLQEWASSTYTPVVLTGGHVRGGRFGTTMICAGDLDQDGYNDVIISAPYAEAGMGVVYVYHGSATGLVDKPAQVISASSLSHPGLTSFGLSLEGGIDVDDNKYPDFLVGAPKSDFVAVFRSRPVVQVTTNITLDRKSIDIIDCLLTSNASCGILTVCFTYTGVSVESVLDIDYQIRIDAELERVQIRTVGASSQGVTVYRSAVTLHKDTPVCLSLRIDTRQNIQDFDTPITANLTYSLTDSHKSNPMASVQRRNEAAGSATGTTVSIPFEKSCGNDTKCHYDLSVNGSVMLPTVQHPSNENHLGGGVTLIVASDDLVVVRVNLTNKGEIAYGTQIAVSYSDGFSWTRIQNVVSSTSSLSCVVDDLGETMKGDLRTNVLSYVHNGFLKDVMLPGSWCYFECVLVTSGFTHSNKTNVDIRLAAYTHPTGNQAETNPSDNSWNSSYGVKYISGVTLRRLTAERRVTFNFTEKTEEISSIYGIGKGTADIPMEHEVQGLGFSTIPHSMISFRYPRIFNRTHRLLYLFRVECNSTSGNAFCICDESNVNPLKLSLMETNPQGNKFNITPNQQAVEPIFFDCNSNNTGNFTSCDSIHCQIMDLGFGDVITFKATFRLWTQTLRLPKNNSISLRSHFTFNAEQSPQIIDAYGQSLPQQTSQFTVTATPYTTPEPIPKNYSWLVFIAAVASGTILLIVIIIIMYKLGFFKSKYAEKKEEAREWQNAESNEIHNPSFSHTEEGTQFTEPSSLPT